MGQPRLYVVCEMIVRIVSTTNVPGAEVISDLQKTYMICAERKYVLEFTSGEVTLRAFKDLFVLGKEALFYVVNFEFFLYKMRLFKHYRFEFVEYPDDARDERVERYRGVERELGGLCTDRGVEVSFRPDVFASMRSSLLSPGLYMCEDNLSSGIYRALERRLGYEELRGVVEKTSGALAADGEPFSEAFDKHLKSLVFSGMVRMKAGMFHRWDY